MDQLTTFFVTKVHVPASDTCACQTGFLKERSGVRPKQSATPSHKRAITRQQQHSAKQQQEATATFNML